MIISVVCSMTGPSDDIGVIPRFCEELVARINGNTKDNVTFLSVALLNNELFNFAIFSFYCELIGKLNQLLLL